MKPQFARSSLILGEEAIEALSHKRVAIFGLGGVGGAAAETLARAGVGEFDLIDSDCFSITNLNRQCLATLEKIGWAKVDAAEERILSINESAIIHKHRCFFLPQDHGDIDFSKFDYVDDAIDTMSAKIDLIKEAVGHKVPIVSATGCGNRIDPSKLRVGDLFSTKDDPLARVLRRELRKLNINKLKVVYSTETPMPLKGTVNEPLPPGKKAIPGSSPFVPPAAGILLGYEVCMDLISSSEN